VWSLLQAFGCEELFPLFRRAGIVSHENLHRFQGLTIDERTAVMNDVRGVDLSVFQKHLLRRLLCGA